MYNATWNRSDERTRRTTCTVPLKNGIRDSNQQEGIHEQCHLKWACWLTKIDSNASNGSLGQLKGVQCRLKWVCGSTERSTVPFEMGLWVKWKEYSAAWSRSVGQLKRVHCRLKWVCASTERSTVTLEMSLWVNSKEYSAAWNGSLGQLKGVQCCLKWVCA